MEETYICKLNIKPHQNNRVVSLIKETENLNCKPLKIDVTSPIVESLNNGRVDYSWSETLQEMQQH